MKPIINAVLASIAVFGLVSACADDSKPSTSGAGGATLAPGETLPDGATLPNIASDFTIPPGGTLPSDFSIPTEAIDQLIAQFETAGIKVDRACFENLLKNDEFRELIASRATPSAEVMQKFTACFQL
jgi:hypothetical protein